MKRREFVKLAAVGSGLVGAASGRSPIRPAYAAAEDPDPQTLETEFGPFTFYSPEAAAWYGGGSYFDWQSTTPNNNGRTVRIFYRTFGNRDKPVLLMIHGYPRFSFDYRYLVERLQEDYFLCSLDFPGFGFSEKPQDNYSYMLKDDARLLDYFVRDILGLDRFHMMAHDRGISVSLAFLGDYLDTPDRDYEITYHMLFNGNIFLPLSNLSQGQRDMLHPLRGPELIARRRQVPRLTAGPAQNVAEADLRAFNDGLGAQLHVGKYLLERAHHEYRWLSNLQESPVPTALFWGLLDTVSPPRVAKHVWATYLNDREVESSFWLLPTAGHTPHRDEPGGVETIVRTCLEGRVPSPDEEGAFLRQFVRERASDSEPVFIGRSRIKEIDFSGSVEYSPAGYDYF